MADELPGGDIPLDQLTERDLLVMTYSNVKSISTDVRDHEGRIRVLESGYIVLNERPHITPKQLWVGVLGVLGSGGGIVALINFIWHR